MKAAILTEIGKPLTVDDVGLPALETGQVLVRVYASGICGKQLGEIAGHFGPDKYLPHLLGHEGGGIVEDIGPGVTQVKKGDHVVLHWRKGKGVESKCPKYAWRASHAGGGCVTTFNEYAVVSENRLTKIPDDIPFDVAALMGCAVTTGMGVVFRDAEKYAGGSIAVIGCGGVGLNVIQGAKIAGYRDIFAFDIQKGKLEMARRCGADNLINIANDPTGKKVFGGYFDVTVDTTGRPDVIALAYHLTGPGGLCIMVGQPKVGESLTIPDMASNMKGKTLRDSQGGGTIPEVDIPRYLGPYRSGAIKLDELITHRFPLEQVNEALDVARSGEAGKIVLEMK